MTESPLQKIHLIGEGEIDDYLIMLPYEKLEAVKAALDAWKIRYYVDEEVLSINNGPETALITLWEKVEKDKLQIYLDKVIKTCDPQPVSRDSSVGECRLLAQSRKEATTMTESRTNEIFLVGGTFDKFLILLPFEKLEFIKAALDALKLRYYVDEEVLSIDDGPETAFITLWDPASRAELQQHLDAAALSCENPVQ